MATNKINKEVQANLKAFCDSVMTKAKNGPRATFFDMVNEKFVCAPEGGVGAMKMMNRPKEFRFYGVYTSSCPRNDLYSDFGVKVPKAVASAKA